MIQSIKPLNLVSKKDYLKSFELNLFPIVEIIKKFKDNLNKNKSSIVLFSTVAVKQGFPNHSIISPVKASLEGLTVSLAAELAPNVRVNCIAPTLTNTPLASGILRNEEAVKRSNERHPSKRINTPSDIASTAIFLLQNNNITGQIINVDGGMSTLKV